MTNLKQIYLLLSENCNLSCSYCFEHKKEKAQMSIELLKESKKFIEENNIETTVLFGGEPTLNEDGLIYCLDNLNNKKILITNGLILKDSILEKLKTSNSVIQFSIDGKYNTMKSRLSNYIQFEAILENLKKCQSKLSEDKIYCHMTITKSNLYSLYENFMFVVSLGIKHIQTTIDANGGYSGDEIVLYMSQLCMIKEFLNENEDITFKPINDCNFKYSSNHFCGTGESFVCVNSKGDIYPCPRMYTNFKDKYKMGNIYDGIINTFDLNIDKGSNRCSKCKNDKCTVCISANLEKFKDINITSSDFCKMSKVNKIVRESYFIKNENKFKKLDREYKEHTYLRKCKDFNIIVNNEKGNIDAKVISKIINYVKFIDSNTENTLITFISSNIDDKIEDIEKFSTMISDSGYNGKFRVLCEKNTDKLNFDIIINPLLNRDNICNLYSILLDNLNNNIDNILFDIKYNLSESEVQTLYCQFEKIMDYYLKNKDLKIFTIDKIIYNLLNNGIPKQKKVDLDNFCPVFGINGEIFIFYNNDMFFIGDLDRGINIEEINRINEIEPKEIGPIELINYIKNRIKS